MATIHDTPVKAPVDDRNDQKFEYPGIPTTCDGAEAVVWVETNISQGSGAYPITSSTTMGGGFNANVMNGVPNLWGDQLVFVEPESEHSAATFCEGFAVAGGRVTNFTSGQGLVLMKEVLYTISGKRLPVVFNIGARALTSHSLNVHAGHDDVMSVADCGWGILFARNAQEAGDLCLIARRAAEACKTPFLNVQDGFLTTHTVESVRLPEKQFMKEYVGKPEDKLVNLMDPASPMMSGVVQNQDSYMKGKIAQRWYYEQVEPAMRDAFDEFYRKTGRKYDFVVPHRCEDAEFIIVGMGCYMETAQATVDFLRDVKGIKAGCLNVVCFRPFPGPAIVDALKDCKAFTILERMDDPLSTTGNHLTREIKAAFCDALTGGDIDRIPRIYSGAAGLGSRDVRPGDIIAVLDNMIQQGPEFFCTGIKHQLALEVKEDPDLRPTGSFSMRGHSVGGFGSVTTNKVIATIGGQVFGKDVQAYPKYGSEKKGLPTTYYLTIADSHIFIHSELEHVNLVVLNDTTALFSGNPLVGLLEGGAIFMQSPHTDPAEVWKRIPPHHKHAIRQRNIRVYFADTVKIAREVASEPDLEMRMQGIVLLGAFLKLTPYALESGMTDQLVYEGVEKALRKYFGKRGEQVVQDNLTCVKRGYNEMQEIPQSLVHAPSDERVVAAANGNGHRRPSMNEASERDPFNNNCYGTLVDSGYKEVKLPVLDVIDFNERIIRGYEEGDAEKDLPADLTLARSLVPAGTAALRDFSYVAPEIPEYIPDNCTGCMDCVTECPDTAILGKVLAESTLLEKLEALPGDDRHIFEHEWSKTRKYYDGPQKKGQEGGRFAIIIDPSKCKGCAECVTVCDDDALKMIPKTDDIMHRIRKVHRFFKQVGPSDERYINENLLIDMMLLEKTHIYVGGAGSCAGCGEGTALRMLCAATGAKFGDQWGIVAATGCNTVYTSTYPYNPYLVPWTNSLFENAPADSMGLRARWDQIGWADKPVWCIGGDGAMFDIGFQSLSRMLASGMNIKVFVLDTQVYSNTGGQASTSSFTGQNTKMSVHGKTFGGKQERRKEIAQIAIMHPRTFVAQTTCAHTNHFYKAVLGALEFDGPAIINCYTTCQPEHGVADNMAADQARLAVDSRAFPLLIYDPRKGDTIAKCLSLQGNPAMKEDWWNNPKTGEVVNFIDFCRSEGRFAKHFDREGNASELLQWANHERLENWHVLQELAGLR